MLRQVALVLEKGEVGERVNLRELWRTVDGPASASTGAILDRLMLMPVVALKLGPGDGQWVITRKEPNVDYLRLDAIVAAIVPPTLPGIKIISKERLRALKLVASTDADRTLIELAALDGLTVPDRTTATGTRRKPTVEESVRKEKALSDALELFAAYDALAAHSALREVEQALNITVAEEDVQRELDALHRSAKVLECDDDDSGSSSQCNEYDSDAAGEAAQLGLRVRRRVRSGAYRKVSRSKRDTRPPLLVSYANEDDEDDDDEDDEDDAYDDEDDDDDNGEPGARPVARRRLRRRRALGSQSPSAKKSSRLRADDADDDADDDASCDYDREDVDAELLDVCRDFEQSVISGVIPDCAALAQSVAVAAPDDLVYSVILSDRLKTDVDEVDVDDERGTTLDRAEAFLSEASMTYTARLARDARAAARISEEGDNDDVPMNAMLSTFDAKQLVTRLVAYHRRRNRRTARAKADVRQSLGSGRWRGRKGLGVLATYPDIGDAYEAILEEMGCGAAAQRDKPDIVLNKARKMQKGTGFERVQIELRKRGYFVSVSTVKRLGIAHYRRGRNAKSYYELVAVKCRRSVKRLGKFNLDCHVRNSKYATMHFIRDRVSVADVMWLERDDKAKVRMNSGECTSQLPIVGDAAGASRPMHDVSVLLSYSAFVCDVLL